MVSRCLVFFRVFLVFCLIDVCLAAVCPIILASHANAAARVALVVGNGEYRYSKPLPNPVNDANDIAAALEQLDFTVIRVFNGDFGKLREGIRTFNSEVEHADIGLVYYAGHGMELGGENYIIPVDAELKTDRDLMNEAIGLKVILQSVGRAGTLGLVIPTLPRQPVRANGAPNSRARRRGPRGQRERSGSPPSGTTATDGDGATVLYGALLKHLSTRGLEVSFVFRRCATT